MRRVLLSACLALSACGRSAPTDTCGLYPALTGAPVDVDTYHEVIDWAVTDLQLVPEFNRDQICAGLARVEFIRVRDDLDAGGAFTVAKHPLFGLTSLNRPNRTSFIDISAPHALTSVLTHELAHAVQIDTSIDMDPEHFEWDQRGIQHAILVSASDIGGYK